MRMIYLALLICGMMFLSACQKGKNMTFAELHEAYQRGRKSVQYKNKSYLFKKADNSFSLS